MDTPNFSGYSRTEMLEGQYEDTDPRKVTAQGSSHTITTLWQPPADGDLTATQGVIVYRQEERITNMENPRTWMDNENRALSHSVNTRLHLESRHGAFTGQAVKKELQEKEENEKLKKRIKILEARNAELLSKAMAKHQDSEDMNDPSRLSVVLQRYEMLRLREWEKVRISSSHWTYEKSHHVIKKLFDACEKDIQHRTAEIFEALGIADLNDAMTNSTQGIMREIRNLFGQPYYQNHSEVYNKMVKDPPVKAKWTIGIQDVEHVDKKDVADWKKPVLLWPIMKCGEQTIVKGVVWDKNTSESG